MFDYHRLFGLEVKVARIFNTYGPRMLENDGRVVSNFIVQALRGEPITVYGTGQQTRSFCFVDDLVRGLQALMESPASVTGPFNLGNPQEMSIETIAREILACTRSSSTLQFRPLPQDDPKRRKPAIDAAEKRLGWRPRVPLKEGLEATIAYFALQLAERTTTTMATVAGRNSTAAAHLALASQR
jgi:UDP-glucuronate decarboxylase